MEYVQGAELPDALCRFAVGEVIDFTTGWTFVVKVAPRPGQTATFTKSTGFVGGVNAVRVVWDDDEIGSLNPGTYVFELTCAATGAKQRRHQATLVIHAAVA